MAETINFEVERKDNIAIFRLNESRFDSTIAGLVKGEFTILLHTEEIKMLIVDLSKVEYCDSSGLSAILLAYRLLQANEGILRILSPTKNVKSLIEISRLDRILPIYDSLEKAMTDTEALE